MSTRIYQGPDGERYWVRLVPTRQAGRRTIIAFKTVSGDWVGTAEVDGLRPLQELTTEELDGYWLRTRLQVREPQ